jgi:hypothetical protein
MQIYSPTMQMQLCIYQTMETQYIENIPLSLQRKLNFPYRKCAIEYHKGEPYIVLTNYTICGEQAKEIIRVLNGYSKANNKGNFIR